MSPSSEIAPAKPPRPPPSTLHSQPQAHQPPELPQKSMKKKSGDANQRSSTESSGSDGTEQVEQVMTQSCLWKDAVNSTPPHPLSHSLYKRKIAHFGVAFCLSVKMSLRAKQFIWIFFPLTGSSSCKSNSSGIVLRHSEIGYWATWFSVLFVKQWKTWCKQPMDVSSQMFSPVNFVNDVFRLLMSTL